MPPILRENRCQFIAFFNAAAAASRKKRYLERTPVPEKESLKGHRLADDDESESYPGLVIEGLQPPKTHTHTHVRA